MSKSWQLFIILAFVVVGLYIGLEVYISVTGGNAEFQRTVDPIENDLREDVLGHIKNTESNLYYEGEEAVTQNVEQEETENQ
jgi:hypothetical protein